MKTVLYPSHLELGAKVIEFAGWEMPIQYKGIIPEHLAVREKVGMFDVSHMGRICVTGKDAESLLDYLSTNKIKGKHNHSATYTVWPMAGGGCVDDVIIYRQDEFHFFVVVNAGNRQKDLKHLRDYAKDLDVHIEDLFDQEGIIALQGPNATALLYPLFMESKSLKNMHFITLSYHGEKIVLSKTGYTGSGGFEIYAPNALIALLWDWLLNEGDPFGLQPIGLGARDTLRLEMGYALYGHEINETISANESVSAWTIKWDKEDFLGKAAMQKLEASPDKRTEYGVILQEKGIAREGYDVYKNGQMIGKVTSGNYAPSLDAAIAIILVKGKWAIGDTVDVQIRQNQVVAKIVALPFLKI